MRKLLLAALLIFAISAGVKGADERGIFGFKPAVETSDTTVRTVKIAKVRPGFPAAAQNIAIGDEIIEADGKSVPGGNPSELRPVMQKRPGETLRLRLKRPSGEIYSVTLTAVKRPK